MFASIENRKVTDDMNQRFPLSKTEYGIFAWQMSEKNTAYNLPIMVRLGNEVNLDRLCEAIKVSVNAHPYLKTAFGSASFRHIAGKPPVLGKNDGVRRRQL